MSKDEHKFIVTDYAHHEIQEYVNTKVPRWLFVIYIILPIWGLYTLWAFLDGSHGWLDRGYWEELQVASKTTFSKTLEQGETPRATQDQDDSN